MAVSELSRFKTVFRFKIKIWDFQEFHSPEKILSRVCWKIKVSKRATDGRNNKVLDVSLFASPLNIAMAAWSCDARATIKLLSIDPEKNIVKSISKQIFSQICSSHEINDFISWNDLITKKNQFFENNEATFEVEISASSLYFPQSNFMKDSSTEFRLIVENVSQLGETLSPEVVLHGMRWKIQTRKNEDFLATYLCAEKDDMGLHWSWEVEYSFKLLSFEPTVEPITRKAVASNHQMEYPSGCTSGCPSWGFPSFVEWTKFVDYENYFVRNDTAIFEVSLDMKLSRPSWDRENDISKLGFGLQCLICYKKIRGREVSSTDCGHIFCNECINQVIEERQECPVCFAPADVDDLRPIFFSW